MSYDSPENKEKLLDNVGIMVDTTSVIQADIIAKSKNMANDEVPKSDKKYLSRADRLSIAIGKLEEAKGEVDELKDEIDQWKDNMPESLQSGQKYSDLEDCSSTLEEVSNNIESAIDAANSVEFPGMFS